MYGKPDALDRLVQVLLALAALFALVFGLFMLADPFGWYQFVDTVKASGPVNAHFIRDIGIAYLVSGALIAFAAANPGLRWGSALVGALWLGAHGVLHIYEVLTGICGPGIFWRDAPACSVRRWRCWLRLRSSWAASASRPCPCPNGSLSAG